MISSQGPYLHDGWCLFAKWKTCNFTPCPHATHPHLEPLGSTGRWADLSWRSSLSGVSAHEDSSMASWVGLDCSAGQPTSCIRFSWDQSPSLTPAQLFFSHVPCHVFSALNLGTPDRVITAPWTPNARPTLLVYNWAWNWGPQKRHSMAICHRIEYYGELA